MQIKIKKPNKTALAKSMGVSRSSLYYKSKLDTKDHIIKEQIESVLNKHPAYGHKRIAIALGYGKNRILRIMKKFGIQPIIQRKKKRYSSNNKLEINVYKNHLKYMKVSYSHQIWATDFTYIRFKNTWYYVATAIDVYTRQLLSVVISTHHTKELVIKAYLEAVKKHQIKPSYIHSDQGSEYTSQEYINLINKHGVIISMSKKGSPWENPYQESFYSNFKLELGNISQYRDISELTEAIYLQVYYYNNKRIHSALKMPPAVFFKLHKSSMKKVS